jgi:hypothetical protein
MGGGREVVARIREFTTPASPDDEARVRNVNAAILRDELEALGVKSAVVSDVVRHWDAFRRDEEWPSLLAALVATVERQRGAIDDPLPIWPDLDDLRESGRFFYFYLFAICHEGTRVFLEAEGTPESVIDLTFSVLERHCATHERKWGTIGVEAGWWMLPILRGELVQVGSLQFHNVTLGVGTLSIASWYSEQEAEQLGPGFRRGDRSIGLHIPRGVNFSPTSLERTFDEAREVLGKIWPVQQRRVATCQSWLLDSRLTTMLPARSNIVQFQRRFTLLPVWYEDDEDILDFVFARPTTPLNELPAGTTLERAIVELLRRGEHWRAGAGWLDFDGR